MSCYIISRYGKDLCIHLQTLHNQKVSEPFSHSPFFLLNNSNWFGPSFSNSTFLQNFSRKKGAKISLLNSFKIISQNTISKLHVQHGIKNAFVKKSRLKNAVSLLRYDTICCLHRTSQNYFSEKKSSNLFVTKNVGFLQKLFLWNHKFNMQFCNSA